MKIDLISPHAPVGCAQRLKSAIGNVLTAEMARQVTGHGTEHEMTLWVHHPHVRNDMKTMLVATMTPFEGGTRIQGRVGGPRSTGLFFGCWFVALTLVLLFGIGMFVVSIDRGIGLHDLIAIVAPLFMIAVGAFILGVGRRHARADRDALLQFLQDKLAARDRRRKYI